MIQTEKRTINGAEWEVTQWPGRHALRMQTRLAKLLGPALARAADGLGDAQAEVLDANVDIAAAVDALVARLDENQVSQLVEDMLNSTQVNGKPASRPEVFDLHFAGNLGELYAGLAFVLEVNFGSLFTAARAIIGGRPSAPAPAAEASPAS